MTPLDRITTRPSYSGHSADALRRSARITANVYGRAYIVVTKSVPERYVGGRVYVTTDPESKPFGPGPTCIVETVE